MNTPQDAGFDLYRTDPTLMLVEVAHHASRLGFKDQPDFNAFMDAYITARRQRDDFEREKNEKDQETKTIAQETR